MDRPWGHKESGMTERLTHTHTHARTHAQFSQIPCSPVPQPQREPCDLDTHAGLCLPYFLCFLVVDPLASDLGRALWGLCLVRPQLVFLPLVGPTVNSSSYPPAPKLDPVPKAPFFDGATAFPFFPMKPVGRVTDISLA